MLQVLNLCETPVTDAGLLALSCEYPGLAAGGLTPGWVSWEGRSSLRTIL